MQEIVIKIPEETYRDVIKNGFIYDEDGEVISHAIINGTLIPKYGILIDYYDAVELINNKADEDNSNFTIGDIEKFSALLREVNPIIEADKENNDEDSDWYTRGRI